MPNFVRLGLGIVASLLVSVSSSHSREQVGELQFPISCTGAAQQQFNRAVALLHSFWYDEAASAFKVVTETDPSCAMGFWGVAMSLWYPLWSPPGEAALKEGASAVAKARTAGAKTDRERQYIEAIGVFYDNSTALDHRTRSIAYEKAMEALSRSYPDDREAAIFYALALNATAPATDKDYTHQKKAAQILNKAFAEQPDHPGVAHYLIHSYDSAPLAELGLPAAICYSKIAPSVPHALHMPSHIFVRLGKWQEAIDSNRAAANAGQTYSTAKFGNGTAWAEMLHALDYLEYSLLQLGRDSEAKEVVDAVVKLQRASPETMGAAYALAAIPARYAIERRDWPRAATLAVPPLAFPWEKFPWTTAMISFSRLLGASRSGDLNAIQNEIQALEKARDAAQLNYKYWADQIEVQRQAGMAMLAHAEKRDDQAIERMRAAAELEASMDKHPVTPGPIVPARELLGDLLIDLDRPAEALSAYELSLSTDPNRLRSLNGAARAAERTGDSDKARKYFQLLVSLGEHADADRQEFAAAKAYLAR